MFQEHETGYPFIAVIGIWKMVSDVAQSGGAEKRIGDGMHEHIGVRVSEQSFLRGNVHTAEHKLPAGGKPMHIESLTYAIHDCSLLPDPESGE